MRRNQHCQLERRKDPPPKTTIQCCAKYGGSVARNLSGWHSALKVVRVLRKRERVSLIYAQIAPAILRDFELVDRITDRFWPWIQPVDAHFKINFT